MQQAAQSFRRTRSSHPKSATIETTLYELMEAISEQVPPGEDRLVAEVVWDLLNGGKIKFRGRLEDFGASWS